MTSHWSDEVDKQQRQNRRRVHRNPASVLGTKAQIEYAIGFRITVNKVVCNATQHEVDERASVR